MAAELRRVGRVTQLHVDGKPFFALGGELGNSTASDLAELETALEKCRRMHLNTVLSPVCWDLVEQHEGEFDFELVKASIDRARACGLRLILLWFGTWKNSMSCYAPSWVKRDTARFERLRRSTGEVEEIISPACAAARDADARAFAALMRWLKQYDEAVGTVIMVQVENEVGMIPEPRDHSEKSECAFRETGGDEEVFTATQFARYIEHVAAAGKREYALPMFANAALIRPGYTPGQYPSGGPLPHLLEVWRREAPSLEMICPDIYFPNFMEWCERYTRGGNPLFIPEMAASARATANAVYAAARFGATGFAPFSIENVDEQKERLIADCYAALAGMSEMILKAQREGSVIGLSPQVGFDWSIDDQPQRGELGGIVFEARFDRPATGGDSATTLLPTLGAGRWDAPPGTPLGSAMIIQLAAEEFAILGMGVTITFAPAEGKGKVGIDRVQEGRYADGTWTGQRWLNGDETHQGRHVHLHDGRWSVQRLTVYRYS